MADRPDKPWWFPETEGTLAVLSLLIFAGALLAVINETIPAPNEKYAMLLLGALIGIVKDTFARYFSVTKGGADLRAAVGNLAKATADTAQVAAATTGVGEK